MGCGKLKPIIGNRCFNLVQNSSFEAGLAGWVTSENVVTTGGAAFEGTQVATMLADDGSMFQDVSLAGTDCSPLFLSFNVTSSNQPKLTVEVLWLDNKHQAIATGLRMFISAGTTNSEQRKHNILGGGMKYGQGRLFVCRIIIWNC